MAFLWTMLFMLATKPLMLLVDLIFSPGGRLEKPILNLKLPEHYLKEGRYEEALAEYRRILKHHPGETEAWEKAIWLESRIFGRTAAAAKLERTARRHGLRSGQRSTPPGRNGSRIQEILGRWEVLTLEIFAIRDLQTSLPSPAAPMKPSLRSAERGSMREIPVRLHQPLNRHADGPGEPLGERTQS